MMKLDVSSQVEKMSSERQDDGLTAGTAMPAAVGLT
jgi:hypothetical protein